MTSLDDNQPTLLLFGDGEPLRDAVVAALRGRAVVMVEENTELVVATVLAHAPDVTFLVGRAAEPELAAALVRQLAAHPLTASSPVAVLSPRESLAPRLPAAERGGVTVVPRGVSADALAHQLLDLAIRLYDDPNAVGHGQLTVASVDELRRRRSSDSAPRTPSGESLQPAAASVTSGGPPPPRAPGAARTTTSLSPPPPTAAAKSLRPPPPSAAAISVRPPARAEGASSTPPPSAAAWVRASQRPLEDEDKRALPPLPAASPTPPPTAPSEPAPLHEMQVPQTASVHPVPIPVPILEPSRVSWPARSPTVDHQPAVTPPSPAARGSARRNVSVGWLALILSALVAVVVGAAWAFTTARAPIVPPAPTNPPSAPAAPAVPTPAPASALSIPPAPATAPPTVEALTAPPVVPRPPAVLAPTALRLPSIDPGPMPSEHAGAAATVERYRESLASGARAVSRGDLEVALSSYQFAVHLKPRSTDALLGMARTYLAAEQPADALRWAERARDTEARGIEGRLMVGDLLLAMGQYEQAMATWREAERLFPSAAGPQERMRRAAADRPNAE